MVCLLYIIGLHTGSVDNQEFFGGNIRDLLLSQHCISDMKKGRYEVVNALAFFLWVFV